MWLVAVLILVGRLPDAAAAREVPGRSRTSRSGPTSRSHDFGVARRSAGAPYMPIFAAFFLLILFSNWAGLVPPVGKVEFLRAPTSDVNVTIGLALVSFFIFEVEGFRRLGVARLPGQVLPVLRVQERASAPGFIAMFVGLIELMLEFVKPLTLSMRLFGNIYGGEVALGVITALTLAILPVALLGLEVMLNFDPGAHLQRPDARCSSLLAIESHHHEEGHIAEERRCRRAIDGQRASRPTNAPSGANQSAQSSRRRPPGSRRKSTNGALRRRPRRPRRHRTRHRHRHPGRHAATAIGRNPDAAGQIRGLAIILAAFAEGLGVLAIVVGLLAIFIK